MVHLPRTNHVLKAITISKNIKSVKAISSSGLDRWGKGEGLFGGREGGLIGVGFLTNYPGLPRITQDYSGLLRITQDCPN